MDRPDLDNVDRPVDEIEKVTDDLKNKGKDRNIPTEKNMPGERPTGTDHPAQP